MGIKYRVLYRQNEYPPYGWVGTAIAYEENGKVKIFIGRSEWEPQVSDLEELTPTHMRPLPGRIRWGLVREWEDTGDPLWIYDARRAPEPEPDLSLDEVRVAIWRWTPEEREALRRELAQEDDWAEAERAWRETLAGDESWAAEEEGAAVHDETAAPALVAVAEPQEAYLVTTTDKCKKENKGIGQARGRDDPTQKETTSGHGQADSRGKVAHLALPRNRSEREISQAGDDVD